MLHAYYGFNVYFFKILSIHIFWANLVPNIWSSSNWLKFVTEVDCYMLISILMFIFSKFLGQIWSHNLKFYKMAEFDTRANCCMLITILMGNCSNNLQFINVWAKCYPKICCSPYLLKFSIELRCNSVNLKKKRWDEICT